MDLVDQMAEMMEQQERFIAAGNKWTAKDRAKALLNCVALEWSQNGNLINWIWYHTYRQVDIFEIVQREQERRAA